MNKTNRIHDNIQRKAAILKQHEVYAYQAAYFLLENEAWAAQAATMALIALAQDAAFFAELPALQQKRMKETVMKHSLLTKAAMLQTLV